MNKVLLYVENVLIDLFDKSLIALTVSFIDIRDLKARFISYTNRFEVPLTENNNTQLGFPDQVKSNSTKPYSLVSARAVFDGIEYFKGKLFTDSAKGGKASISILDDTADVFSLIKGRKLSDGISIPATAWNASDIDGFRAATTGVTAPLIDWGRFDEAGFDIEATFYLPSYFYSEIVNGILDATGYTFTGNIFTEDDFLDLIIPFGNDEFIYNEEFQTERTFDVSDTVGQTILDSGVIDFTTFTKLGLYFNSTNNRYEIPNFSSSGTIGKLKFTWEISFEVSGTPSPGDEIRVGVIRSDNPLIYYGDTVVTYTSDPSSYGFIVSGEATFEDSQYFVLTIVKENTFGPSNTLTIDITSVRWTGYISREPYRNYLFHSYLLPDIDQYEILEDFFVRFGAMMFLRNNEVQVVTIDELLSRKGSALDWTAKRVKAQEEISFEYESYSQSNYFNYDQGDDVLEEVGRGTLEVTNENIELENDFFDSVFENCNTEPKALINMAEIPVYDGTSASIDDFANSPGLKILTLRDKESFEPDITFNSTPRSDYKVAYFVDSSKTKDTGFQYFIDNYYGKLQNSLDKTKVITRQYYLNVFDVMKVNENFNLVYDSGNYFLVNKIDSFIPGRLTKVELLRIF